MSAVTPDDPDKLAGRLAELIRTMRPTSRFNVAIFLQAVEAGHLGAELTLHASRKGRPADASLSIEPGRVVDLSG